MCEAEATVHETQIVNGQVMVRRLCERHAAEVGLTGMAGVPSSGSAATVVLNVQQQAGTVLKCPTCGLSYAAFRQHGLLGCSQCYEAFEDKLAPLIERAHQGGTHHIGKTPKRMLAAAQGEDPQAVEKLLGSARERAERVALLRKQLEDALAQEQYERAAAVRDELRRYESQEPGSNEPGSHGPGASGEQA
ncbi:MAG: UvrB/UvrC motif-containing protein [Phycisphaerales bacterium JB064]